MQTMGTNLNFVTSDWNLYGTFYFQTGKNAQKQRLKPGCGLSLKPTTNSTIHGNLPWAAIGFSGDNHPAEGLTKLSIRFYGTHHKFYGAMDYYYASGFFPVWLPDYGTNQLGVSFKASKDVVLQQTITYFRQQQTLKT